MKFTLYQYEKRELCENEAYTRIQRMEIYFNPTKTATKIEDVKENENIVREIKSRINFLER